MSAFVAAALVAARVTASIAVIGALVALFALAPSRNQQDIPKTLISGTEGMAR
jgi:hypothetical protein